MGRFNILSQFRALGQIAKTNLGAMMGSPTRTGTQSQLPDLGTAASTSPFARPQPASNIQLEPQTAQPQAQQVQAIQAAQPQAIKPQPQPQQSNAALAGLEEVKRQALAIQSQLSSLQQPPAVPAAPPAAPEITPAQKTAEESQTQLKALQEQFAAGQAMTAEESQTQEQLNQLIASSKLGMVDISGKPIALPFITGQQAALERRVGALAEPLTSRLALLQSQREAKQRGLEARLGFAEKAEQRAYEAAKPKTPTEVSGRLVDLTTGKVIYEPPAKIEEKKGFELGSGQARYEFDPTTGTYKQIAELPKEPSEAEKLREITKTEKAEEKQETKRAAMLRTVEGANTAIQFIDSALGNKEAINTNPAGRLIQSKNPFSNEYTLARDIDTIKSLIGFDALEQMRKASPTGGALGQVSERELAFLQATRGSLDLGQKSDILKRNLESIRQSFVRIQRLIQVESGEPITVKAMSQKGETITISVNKEDLTNLILEGNKIEY